MGRLYIPAVNQIDGPWLISHDNLETLNDLFNEIDNRLRKALLKHIEATAKQQIEDEVQTIDTQKRIAKLQRKYSSKAKEAVVNFADGSSFEATEVKEILDHINSHSTQSPVELYIRSMHGNHDNEFSIVIIGDPGKEDPDFEYQIRCLDYDIQLEIKTLIDKWIRNNKPSRPLQVWNNYVEWLWIACVFVILFAYSELSYTVSNETTYRNELKKEAQRIIEDQSYSSVHDSALLVLLKLESDYIPEKIKSQNEVVYDKGKRKMLIISLIIFGISLVRPKTTIGIGRKINKYKFYQFWWKYIIIGATSLLLTTILADSFLRFINW